LYDKAGRFNSRAGIRDTGDFEKHDPETELADKVGVSLEEDRQTATRLQKRL
jgi:hypothetical protein